MADPITLPARPEPDGYLSIRIARHLVDVNAYRDSTMEAYARAAVEADRQARKPLSEEHPMDDPFLRHEALDRTCLVAQQIDTLLLQHRFIRSDAALYAKVRDAAVLLNDAYQIIGAMDTHRQGEGK